MGMGRMKVKKCGKSLAGPFARKGQGQGYVKEVGFGISKANPIVNQIIILHSYLKLAKDFELV